jgi:hypothetical protein
VDVGLRRAVIDNFPAWVYDDACCIGIRHSKFVERTLKTRDVSMNLSDRISIGFMSCDAQSGVTHMDDRFTARGKRASFGFDHEDPFYTYQYMIRDATFNWYVMKYSRVCREPYVDEFRNCSFAVSAKLLG